MEPEAIDRVFAGMNCFPTTPFATAGDIDLGVFREHVTWQMAADPAALFPACGTGEFWSLTATERTRLHQCAVDLVGDRIPVIAGWAGTTPEDLDHLTRLADLGINGVLMMPPDPWPAGPDGMRRYHAAAAARTTLPRILYIKSDLGRPPGWWVDTAREVDACGLKDGTGDLDFVTGLVAEGWPVTRLINGTPTAEWLAPAYHAVGVRGWSSAIMNFAPELALRTRHALLDGDQDYVSDVFANVLLPLRRLRREDPGHAIALIKAAVGMRSIPAGRTRPPISWPSDATIERLADIVSAADRLAPSTRQDVSQ